MAITYQKSADERHGRINRLEGMNGHACDAEMRLRSAVTDRGSTSKRRSFLGE
ncbi:hypothetical protein ACFSUD_15400 [Sulfitobacter aestuarii]|uniref:Uncharacterized protein n=1 Tax=Sulfitobacter aestuarii TaxID=2161676 RepID=A0ABW5U6P1_9RHOB